MKFPRQPVESQQLAAIGYDPTTQTLDVEFVNRKPGTPPSVYRYQDVPPEIHRQILDAESIGKEFGELVRKQPDRYPFRKLTDQEAEQENAPEPTE